MKRIRPLSRVASVFALVLALLVLHAGPSIADDYDQCDSDTGCEPDNQNHTWCYSTGMDTFNETEAAAYGVGNLSAETAFYDTYMQNCDGSSDILFRGADLSSGTLGDYLCLDFTWNGDCGQARVRLDSAAHNGDLDRDSTMCHEVGHSGGLTHHSGNYDDCMWNSHYDGNTSHLHYNSHHEGHLNTLD